jgi:hypothetical protein
MPMGNGNVRHLLHLETGGRASVFMPLGVGRVSLAALEAEARVLLRYVACKEPSQHMIDQYRQGVLLSDDAVPARLPMLIRRHPPLLRFCEPFGRPRARLSRRLKLAVMIAEASPQGIRRMFSAGQNAAIVTVLRLAGLLIIEALLLPSRLVFGLLCASDAAPEPSGNAQQDRGSS